MRKSFFTGRLVFKGGLELGIGHICKLVYHNESFVNTSYELHQYAEALQPTMMYVVVINKAVVTVMLFDVIVKQLSIGQKIRTTKWQYIEDEKYHQIVWPVIAFGRRKRILHAVMAT